jgi:hypothetical protein
MVIPSSPEEERAYNAPWYRADFIEVAQEFIEGLPIKPRPDSASALNEQAFNRLEELLDQNFLNHVAVLCPPHELSLAEFGTSVDETEAPRPTSIPTPVLRLYATLQSIVPALKFRFQTDLQDMEIDNGIVVRTPEKSKQTALQELLASNDTERIYLARVALTFISCATKLLDADLSPSPNQTYLRTCAQGVRNFILDHEVRIKDLNLYVGALRDLCATKKEADRFDPLSASISHITRPTPES